MPYKKLFLSLLISISANCYAEDAHTMELDNTNSQPSSTTLEQHQVMNMEF